jgi:hypothetical protein
MPETDGEVKTHEIREYRLNDGKVEPGELLVVIRIGRIVPGVLTG